MNLHKTALLALALCVTPFTAVAATITVDGSSCTLTNAILAANTDAAVGGCTAGDAGADTIVLNADVTLSTADTVNSTVVSGAYAGLPDVTSEITIEAGTATLIERDSSLGCVDPEPVEFRIFNVFGSGVALTLDGVTVQNGCVNGYGGAITVKSGASLTVHGCTVTNNQALNVPSGNIGRGGAIYVLGGSLSVTSSTISDNRASEEQIQGGAICVFSGAVGALDGNTFSNNTAEAWDNASGAGSFAYGGAIYLNVNATSVSDNTFTGNVAQGGGGSTSGGVGLGGAFYQHTGGTIATMSNNIFTANQALGGPGGTGNGGGGYAGAFRETNVTIFSANIFTLNLAQGGDSASADGGDAYAGAAYGGGNSGVYDTVTFLDNSAIGGNGAVNGGLGEGGALEAYWLLSNSSFSGNTAQGGDGISGSGGDALGGAWYIGDEYASNHVTVAGNQAIAGSGGTSDGTASGGGIFVYDSYGFYLSNCIIADNTVTPVGGSATADDCGWGVGSYDQSGGYNFIEAPGNCVFTYAPSDVTGIDPALDSLVSDDCRVTLPDGSCIETWALSSSSPVIDKGSCTVSGAMLDQRGFVRPFDDPGSANADDACDPGAFEWTSDSAEALYGVVFDVPPGGELHIIDRTTGTMISNIGELTFGTDGEFDPRGIAMDPVFGVMYGIVSSSTTGFSLCALGLGSAEFTEVANYGFEDLSDLTFDSSGQLYAVGGSSGAYANSLMLVDKVTGALTLKTAVGAGNQHGIAFNPQEPGLIYHRYGSSGFETIDIATDAVTAIGSAPSSGAGQEKGMVWDPVNSVFRFTDTTAWITLTTAGARTDTGSTASAIYSGLAFDKTSTVPVELQSFSVE